MQSTCTIILAAGKGTRLKSAIPKVMHEILGVPLIHYPISLAQKLDSSVIAVVGHGREAVGPYLSQFPVTQVVQDPPMGTGHAVMVTTDALKALPAREVMILPGDMPLIQFSSLQALREAFKSSGAPIGILTAVLPDAFGYGRIIRSEAGDVTAIVEHNDATDEERAIHEINTGVFILNREFLLDSVNRLTPNNAKGEYYITDIVKMADKVAAFTAPDFNEAHGINSRSQLAHAASLMQARINEHHMDQGITLIDPRCVWISPLAAIAGDVEIWPGVQIMGKTTIDSGTKIMPNTWIGNSHIGARCSVGNNCLLENTSVDKDTDIPAYSRIQEKISG
jgi:bifunctional UDP-N-acetylglucosamine pyrophosphorylase / glucosamine-1-phosphate N-acetyltransferase